MTSARTRDRLIERLKVEGIKNAAVLERIRAVPRHLFVDEALASRAYEDTALPIGFGQTISQPYIVAAMTEALDRRPGQEAHEACSRSARAAAIRPRCSRRSCSTSTASSASSRWCSARARCFARAAHQQRERAACRRLARLAQPGAVSRDSSSRPRPRSFRRSSTSSSTTAVGIVIPIGARGRQTLLRVTRNGDGVQARGAAARQLRAVRRGHRDVNANRDEPPRSRRLGGGACCARRWLVRGADRGLRRATSTSVPVSRREARARCTSCSAARRCTRSRGSTVSINGDLARWNGMRDPDLMRVGQRLRLCRRAVRPLPRPRRRARSARAQPSPTTDAAAAAAPRRGSRAALHRRAVPRPRRPSLGSAAAPEHAAGRCAAPHWSLADGRPRRHRVRRQRRHRVRASASVAARVNRCAPPRAGRVVYAGGGLIGYGQLVIIKHDETFLSAYGHNADAARDAGPRRRARCDDRADGAGARAPAAPAFRNSPQRRARRSAARQLPRYALTAQCELNSAATTRRCSCTSTLNVRHAAGVLMISRPMERAASSAISSTSGSKPRRPCRAR